ncbi:hypothetical protein [Pelagicoccus sp. SDUM812003]|uniref:RCC1 domain-containing protein n=1 Tax=Pelagicoccus sp. SDUM812003 TaxID=3041267 RepID=UPI00280E4CD9|nr:hypothetical protein [Pelagicoccus sp. SDUM812003]MDQ8203394.1 hypothetical protein [Pelagicoccus sp. SDUM812003]
MTSAGDLRVSGDNSYGQLGNGESDFYNEFVKVAENVESVSVGGAFALYMDSEGKLWLLGWNSVGTIDDASDLVFGETYATPTFISDRVTRFEAGDVWNFFQFENDDQLYSTGMSTTGVDGWGIPFTKDTPTLVEGVSDIEKAVATYYSALFLDADGRLYGRGDSSHLGFDFWVGTDLPVQFAEGVLDIGFAGVFAAYLHSSGELRKMKYSGGYEVIDTGVIAFSASSDGTFYYLDGESNLYSRSSPATEKTFIAEGVSSVLADGEAVFYITSDNALWALGDNRAGLMGKGDFAFASEPVKIRSDVKSISANGETLYVVEANGDLYAAGSNSNSKMGLQLSATPRDPIALDGFSAKRVEAGYDNLFFIDHSDDLYGLGRNDFGQLGLGDTDHRKSPQLIASGVKQVSLNGFNTAGSHAVYTDISGDLWGMGSNSFFQISDEGGEYHSPQLIESEVSAAIADTDQTAYLKKDGTLWLRGGYETGARKIAEGVADFDVEAVLFYLTEDGDLVTRDEGFISRYKTENGINNWESIESLVIDTEVKSLDAERAVVAYIKEDASLWISGARGFIADGDYVVEPLKIDTDVEKVSFSGTSMLYQKLDGTMWLIAKDISYYPSEYENVSDVPVQVFDDLIVTGFSVGETNTAILVDLPYPPVIEETVLQSSESVAPGDVVTLEVDITGTYSEIDWYEGDVGDKSKPLIGKNGSSAVVYPLLSTRYWVEVSNAYGSAQSEASVEVAVDNPAYGTWAQSFGLEGAHARYADDFDHDGNPNLLEFAYDLDPTKADPVPWSIELKLDENACVFSIRNMEKQGIVAAVQALEVESKDWILVGEAPDLEVLEGDESIEVVVPLASLAQFLLRLKLELE